VFDCVKHRLLTSLQRATLTEYECFVLTYSLHWQESFFRS